MTQKLRVHVNGAAGRMGTHVVAAVSGADDMELVGTTDLGDDLVAALSGNAATVVVDFTQPDSCVENVEKILEAGAHPVIGTTGFSPGDIERLQSQSAALQRGGLIAPNFAIGAVLLMRFAAEAARHLPAVEVIEMHHDQKLDAPSGTAVKTVEMIRAAAPQEWSAHPDEKETVAGARGGRLLGVPIHSVRLPGFVAHEEVLFGGSGQILSIRHDSISRESFMPGVLLAARRVPELKRIEYGLETLLG